MLPTVGVASSRAKKTKGCVTWHTKGPLRVYISHSWWMVVHNGQRESPHPACNTPARMQHTYWLPRPSLEPITVPHLEPLAWDEPTSMPTRSRARPSAPGPAAPCRPAPRHSRPHARTLTDPTRHTQLSPPNLHTPAAPSNSMVQGESGWCSPLLG